MRGVYFKNMKWQAAIKVEKKQVHLGTVDSQKEAAHLYDRFVILIPQLITISQQRRMVSKHVFRDSNIGI